MKTAIKFLHPWNVYNAGEVACFEDAQAKDLVRKGYAVLKNPKEADAEKLRALAKHVKDPQTRDIKGPGETKAAPKRYFCNKCKRNHASMSRIGAEHKSHADNRK